LHKIWPLIYDGQSDSASFDNALELLVDGRLLVAHAMMMMIPEAWENHSLMDPTRRAFYEYHAAMMEPWDGPASIAFTDGRRSAPRSTANGLRPSRYIVTEDDLVIMGRNAAACRCRRRESSRSGVCSPARCSSSTWRRAASSTTRS